jgi:hypothetical protein
MDTMKYKKSLTQDLAEIATKLKAGGKYEDYSEDLDILLGTGMVKRNEEAEEIFEHSKEGYDDNKGTKRKAKRLSR